MDFGIFLCSYLIFMRRNFFDASSLEIRRSTRDIEASVDCGSHIDQALTTSIATQSEHIPVQIRARPYPAWRVLGVE
jgi:hypothetical protein